MGSKDLYLTRPDDFYAAQMDSPDIRGAWFRARQRVVSSLIDKYYQGGRILDVGCGNSLWNTAQLPVMGIDICEGMLRHNAMRSGRFSPVVADFYEALPVRSESVDLVVITEILEHMSAYELFINEVHRVLRPGGVVVISVPYEEFPGIWGGLFSLWCAYKGWRDQDEYYRRRCGHVVRFGPSRLRQAFAEFVPLEQRSLGFLTVFLVVQKRQGA